MSDCTPSLVGTPSNREHPSSRGALVSSHLCWTFWGAGGNRQTNGERRTLSDAGTGPVHGSSVQLHQLTDDSKPETQSGVTFRGRVFDLTEALEYVCRKSGLMPWPTRREEILGRLLFDVFADNPGDASASGVRNLTASLDRVRERGASDPMDVPDPELRAVLQVEIVAALNEDTEWTRRVVRSSVVIRPVDRTPRQPATARLRSLAGRE